MARKVGQLAVSFEDQKAPKEVEIMRKFYENSADVIEDVGPFGRYQIYTCFVLQYAAIIGAGIFAFGNFGNLFPLFSCSNHNSTFLKAQYENPKTQHLYKCTVKNNCTNRTVEIRQFLSVAEEWLLVCDSGNTVQIILLMTGLGRILGSIFGGHISDYWGRKRVLYPSQFLVCIISTLSTASTQWFALAVFMFFVGFSYGMGESAAFVLVMEKTDRHHRWITNSCFQWCIQYPIVALIAYLTAYWRLYLIVINVILAPLLVFFLVFLESPRYLIYQDYLEHAAKTLSDMASDRWNGRGIDFTEDQLKGIPKRQTPPLDPRYPSPLELIRTWYRARLTLTLMLAMVMRSMLSNAFIQESGPVGGNPFINIGLYGLIRIWVPFFLVFGDRRFPWLGRRMLWILFFGLIFFTNLTMLFLHVFNADYGVQLQIIALLGAGMCASGGWMVIGQLMVECYPTAIRGIAFGWISSLDGLGGMLVMYVEAFGNYWEYLPDVIYLVLCGMTLVMGYWIIPETKSTPLQDSLDQMDNQLELAAGRRQIFAKKEGTELS